MRGNMLFKQSIRGQLSIAMMVSLAALLLLAGGMVLAFTYKSERTAWQGRHQDIANLSARRITDFTSQTVRDINLVANMIGQAEIKSVAHNILEQNPSLLEMIFLDRDGEILYSAARGQELLNYRFTRTQSNWFKTALGGKDYYGDLQISPQGKPYIILALPRPWGVAAARLDMKQLWDETAGLEFGAAGVFYIVDQDGVIISHKNPQYALNYQSLDDQEKVFRALTSGQPRWIGSYANLEGEWVVGASTPINGTSWTLISEIPQREAYANTRNALFSLGSGILVLWILAIWSGYRYLNRKIIRPIESLRQGAHLIGEGDLSYQIGTTAQDEIGIVSRTFNEMARNLLERDNLLQARTKALAVEVAERKRVEQSLRDSEERYSLAARGANDGLWDWDLLTNSIYYSPRWQAMLGLGEEQPGNTPEAWFELIHPEDMEHFQLALHAHLQGSTTNLEVEYRIRHSDGVYRWMLTRGLAVRDEQGVATRMAGSQTDITLRKRVEDQLVHDAMHDALTSLPNRVLFIDRLEHTIQRALQGKQWFYHVIFFDIDNFKLINDSMGHVVGDKLLVAIAGRLKMKLRSSDTLARIGGDEFVILLEDVLDEPEAIRIAERLKSSFKAPFKVEDKLVYVSISIGIVRGNEQYQNSTDVLRDADIAMYKAKASGKDQIVFFDTEMRSSLLTRMEMEHDLRQALASNQLALYYQPIISLRDGALSGFEALLRWQHPTRGLIPPLDFIPLAEETGLMLPIGEWVLRKACHQMREWQLKYPSCQDLYVSINLSGVQLTEVDLPGQIHSILEETNLSANSLELEITESVILRDVASTLETISKIRALGVRVNMDDFGTGYSSLSYLQQYTFDTIKIDRSFVQKADSNNGNAEVVRVIINLARALGMGVVAEGIESQVQLSLLKSLECDLGQ